MSEKLQKVLARVGMGSRRFMEEVIAEGRVSINGRIADLGDRVEENDDIRMDGRLLPQHQADSVRTRVIAYYKPEGEVCSRADPEGRATVFDNLPMITDARWVMIGRLDINSSGLLLFTSNGDLANKLMHPSQEMERVYAVRVLGEVTPEMKRTLEQGVELDDGMAHFDSLSEIGGEGANRWYQVILREGRNREVRRLFESQSLKVSRLLRTRYGPIILPRELRTGRWMELDKPQIDLLLKSVEMPIRHGTGLYGMAKKRQMRLQENPLPARRNSYLRKNARHRNNDGES